MIAQITLPWWGWGYLLVTLFFFVIGVLGDDKKMWNEIVSSALSLFSICLFVIGFFNYFIVDAVDLLFIPMFLIGIYWEFTKAVVESSRAEEELAKEAELNENERLVMLNVAIAFNACLVVPGYVMGLILCFSVLGLI